MREKNEMGEGGCMCVVREKKKERQGCTWVVGKNKKEKRNGEWGGGFTCMVGKKGEWKRKKEKNLKGKKLNWFYLYIHFVWYKV